MKWLDDWLGITTLRDQNAALTDKLKAANDFIYQVSKDKTDLVNQNMACQANNSTLQVAYKAQIASLTNDLNVSNGAVESLKAALATAETEIPTMPPAFIDYTNHAYLPNIQVLYPNQIVDSITVFNPCDIYTRSGLLNRSLDVNGIRKLPKYQKLMKVWEFVVKALVYQNDFQDNWQFSPATILRKKGDCEDGTITFIDAARAVGLSATDVFNQVGDTDFGYHSYPIAYLSAADIAGTICEKTGEGFYIFESTLDFLPAGPQKLNGSVYYCDGGVANWTYQGKIKMESSPLFNGIFKPSAMPGSMPHKIDRSEDKHKAILKHWRDFDGKRGNTRIGEDKGVCLTISDSQTGVMDMGMKEYFDQHTTQRWYFKHGVVLLAGAIVTLGLQAATAGLIDVKYAAVVVTVLNMLNDKLRLINPDAPWVGVGAQKKA